MSFLRPKSSLPRMLPDLLPPFLSVSVDNDVTPVGVFQGEREAGLGQGKPLLHDRRTHRTGGEKRKEPARENWLCLPLTASWCRRRTEGFEKNRLEAM